MLQKGNQKEDILHLLDAGVTSLERFNYSEAVHSVAKLCLLKRGT